MEIEIDQSFKVEHTNRPTAIAFSNNVVRSILIPARVKQETVQRLRTFGKKGKRITLHLFAAAIFILIRDHLPKIDRIVIDQEYEGNEADLRQILLNFIWVLRPKFSAKQITFRRIGRQSRAHLRAIEVHRGNVRPDACRTSGRLDQPDSAWKIKSPGKPFAVALGPVACQNPSGQG